MSASTQLVARWVVVAGVILTNLHLCYKQVYVDALKTPDVNVHGRLSRWGQMTEGGEVIYGYEDTILHYAEGINQFFINNTKYRDALLIFASGNVDIMLLIAYFRWAGWGISWR